MAHGHFDQFAQTPTVWVNEVGEIELAVGGLRLVFSAAEARLAAEDLSKAADAIFAPARAQKGGGDITEVQA